MNRLIFVTGFARGGTSWVRDCIAFHPDIEMIPKEMTVFRDLRKDRHAIECAIGEAIQDNGLTKPQLVNKAPANAPFVADACRMFPESKFIFVIRDPRDVFISHKRGNWEWMGGRNKTVAGCMQKTETYYEGYRKAADCRNLLLVRYEDLHQDFHAEMDRIYRFVGAHADQQLLDACFEKHNFVARTGRRREDRDSPRRKGVVGDWVNFIKPSEVRWYKRHTFWKRFMKSRGYGWAAMTYESILQAMIDAGVHVMDEEDVLNIRLQPDRPSLLLLHDIDLLHTVAQRQSVLTLARIEGQLGIASAFNFLPLDDSRYQPLAPESVVEIAHEVRRLAPRAVIGLHLNATERFLPASMPEAPFDHPLVTQALEYLHEQIDAYAAHGIRFRMGTAHGYGRREKEPNNASQPFRDALGQRGIRLIDCDLRRKLNRKAASKARINDVGGSLSAHLMPNNGRLDDPETFAAFPPGSVIHMLFHPGNYDVTQPLTLGLRTNRPGRLDLATARSTVGR